MTTSTDTLTNPKRSVLKNIDLNLFIQDHVTSTWFQTLWVFFLTGITYSFWSGQLDKSPITTIVITAVWGGSLWFALRGEILRQHTNNSRWLQNSLYSSITNTLLTLLLSLAIVAAVSSFWNYAVTTATFDPAVTAPEFRTPETGASWGVLRGEVVAEDGTTSRGALKLLTTGTLDPKFIPRVSQSLWFMIIMIVISLFVYNERFRDRVKPIRKGMTALWLLSPVVLYVFLAGMESDGFTINTNTLLTGEVILLGTYALLYSQRVVKFSWPGFLLWALGWPALYLSLRFVASTNAFPLINVDQWSGLLFTMIISVFAILASFPLGVALALGRRSEVYGIPAWITWPLALGVTIWGFNTSTPVLLEAARNNTEKIIAYWPILIILIAYVFQRLFKGNVVAAASTIYIEVIRGIPLITILFMAIIVVKMFFPSTMVIKNAFSVMIGFALFTAAYLAENVRGGLQSIPKGQYEAADAIGLNSLQKMRFIIMPQALRAVIPAIVGLFIGVFKDSSLVAVVGLFDLLGITNPIISNFDWLGLRTELYIFAASIYFVGSFTLSSYSRRLEARLGVGER